MSKADGGAGFPSFIDRCYKMTANMIHRAQRKPSGVREAVRALCERPMREIGAGTIAGLEAEILPRESSSLWIMGLVKYMAVRGATLRRGGAEVPPHLQGAIDLDISITRCRAQDEDDTTEVCQGQAWWDEEHNEARGLLGRTPGGWQTRRWVEVATTRRRISRNLRLASRVCGKNLRLSPETEVRGGGSYFT